MPIYRDFKLFIKEKFDLMSKRSDKKIFYFSTCKIENFNNKIY